MTNDPSSIRRAQFGSFEALVIDNAALRLTIVPELGGKIVSLVRLESGREYLLQSRKPERTYRARSYGDKFEEHETTGFDECLPTVAQCRYPEEPFLLRQLPDHGDIWSLPVEVEVDGEQLRLTSHVKSLPLRLTKEITLGKNTARFDYEATNLSSMSLKFLWSAHPLLAVEPGAEIILPKEVEDVEVAWSSEDRLGRPGSRCGWPVATDRFGGTVKLDRIASPNAGTAEKLFTSRLSEGFCRVVLPPRDEGITFRFDPLLVPYLGIWICQGGWPMSGPAKDFAVALEPCSGRPDSLEEAVRRNECAVVRGGDSIQWWMEIELNGAVPREICGPGDE